MSKFKERSQTIEAITFDELVAHGIANGANVVNGMPRSFAYSGHAVSHENDDCYLITDSPVTLRFQRGEMLVTDDRGGLCVLRGDLFDSHYEPERYQSVLKEFRAAGAKMIDAKPEPITFSDPHHPSTTLRLTATLLQGEAWREATEADLAAAGFVRALDANNTSSPNGRK